MPSAIRICPWCMLEHPESLRCEEAQAEHLRLMKARENVQRAQKATAMQKYREKRKGL